jgi:hypothetical protein
MGLLNTQEPKNSLVVEERESKRGNDTMPERIPINVAVSVLADISLGIYRTPANALKELVSNAFDADATRVMINTGFPYFRAMTCRDNGRGMSPGEFRRIMSIIGGSIKRKGGKRLTDEKRRPIIGKIGIGILAVAQICRRFTIISSQRDSGIKLEAHVDFTPFATEAAKGIPLGTEEAVKIGSYELFDDLPEEPDARYTRVILEDIDPGFRERLLEASGPETKIQGYRFRKGDPKTLTNLLEWLVGKRTSVREIPDYLRLLWELGVTCPVPYLEDGPIKGHDIIPDIKQGLLDYDFTVMIDGLELRKPTLLPTSSEIRNRQEDYEIYDVEFDDMVEGKRLAFKGYIYYQRQAIWPPELRGLLVRIQNVAIGMYDKSLLNYPMAQGPRMAMLSGEIYVEEGLEDALNVDRNSFRETDPHYIKLQEVVYKRLGGDKETRTPGIFSDISKYSAERNEARRKREEMQAREKILADIETLWGISSEIELCEDDSPVPVEVDVNSGRIVIYERHPIFPRARAARRILERILVAYELANGVAESKNAVREEFYRLLMES